MVHSFNLSIVRVRGRWICEFDANLVYIVSFRPARTTYEMLYKTEPKDPSRDI